MMSLKFNTIPLLVCLMFSALVVSAQNTEVIVTGTVKEKLSQQPVEFATVMIGNKETGEAITGTTTGVDGSFSITTTAADFFVEVSFIGYESERKRDLSIKDGKVDAGDHPVGRGQPRLAGSGGQGREIQNGVQARQAGL